MRAGCGIVSGICSVLCGCFLVLTTPPLYGSGPLESEFKPKNKDSVSPRSGLIRFLWVSGNPLIRLDMTGTACSFYVCVWGHEYFSISPYWSMEVRTP